MAYRYKRITKLNETYPNEQICVSYKNPIKNFTVTASDKRLDAALFDADCKLLVWRSDEDPNYYEGFDENGRLREMIYNAKYYPDKPRKSNELKAIKELWEAFGEVPIDNNDKILERFCKFPQGTSKFEVWTWFEEEFNVSVAMDLMGLEGSGI